LAEAEAPELALEGARVLGLEEVLHPGLMWEEVEADCRDVLIIQVLQRLLFLHPVRRRWLKKKN
jgi:hypothetical protein